MAESEILEISVVIPTLNCAKRLKSHMTKAEEWLPFVRQVIIVDSYSTDGTSEIIQAYEQKFGLTTLSCPKGLYSSWNYGVAHTECPYVYFSTVGDTITYDGLKSLYQSAEHLGAEVVISPPVFEFDDRCNGYESQWPIHEIVERLDLNRPILCDPRLLYDFILVFLERGILGSSASNLYRAETLKRLPFSEDYYAAGDSAWMVQNCFDVKTAIVPQSFSTFLFHKKDWSFDSAHIKSSQMLRERFAFEAFLKSIENTRTLSENLSSRCQELVIQALDAKQINKCERLSDLLLLIRDFQKLKKMDHNESYEFRAIILRLEFLCEREIGRRYRKFMGAARNLWPPALSSRRRLKDLRVELSNLITDVPIADYTLESE